MVFTAINSSFLHDQEREVRTFASLQYTDSSILVVEFLGKLTSAATGGYDLAIEAQGVVRSLSSVINLMQSSLSEDFMQLLVRLQRQNPVDLLCNLAEQPRNRLADMARGMLDIMVDAKDLLVGFGHVLDCLSFSLKKYVS